MKDKMRSFLNSIHIENVDDFDLDFEMVGRNRFNFQQIDMLIVKEQPWDYELLRQFLNLESAAIFLLMQQRFLLASRDRVKYLVGNPRL